jgi:hypothetical protein
MTNRDFFSYGIAGRVDYANGLIIPKHIEHKEVSVAVDSEVPA